MKRQKKLPFELHNPRYKFCSPGTKLDKRMARNDIGINPLDEACKVHNIAYASSTRLEDKHKADEILEEAALKRLSSAE